MTTFKHLPYQPSIEWREVSETGIQCDYSGCKHHASYCRSYHNCHMPGSSFEYLCSRHACMMMHEDIARYYEPELAASQNEESEQVDEQADEDTTPPPHPMTGCRICGADLSREPHAPWCEDAEGGER